MMRWLLLSRVAVSRVAIGIACALALVAYPEHASAITVDSVGDSFTIDLDGNIGGDDVAGLSASALFEVASISRTRLVLDITLTNTSTVLWERSRVSAFGFDTGPDIMGASLSSSAYSDVNLGGRFPNGFGSLDLCVINNRNNCSGGGSGGLNIGESTRIRLTLNFTAPITTVELDRFGVRYQSLSSNALGYRGSSGTGRQSIPGNPIPEPRSTALFLLGGLLVVALARRQVLTARC